MSNTETHEPFISPLSPIPIIRSERERLPESLQPSHETFPTVGVFDSVIETQNNLNEQLNQILVNEERRTPTRLEILANRGSNITSNEIEELRNIEQGETKNPNGGKKEEEKQKKESVENLEK